MARSFRSVAACLSAALLTCVLALPVAAAPNELSNPSITPSSGTTDTSFTFRVRYDSGQGGTAPNWVRATLTGLSPINLSLVSGSAAHGTYGATTTLPEGTRSVTFRADAPTGVDPLISGGTVTVDDDPPTPTPTPTPTASPTATPQPTTAPTATPTASSPSSAAATPRQTQPPTSVPPTPGGGVLSGTPAATASPAAPGAPVGSGAAGPSSTPGGSAEASGAAGTPGSDPGGGAQGPVDEDGDAGLADRGGIPAAAIWFFVGGAISITGAATLGVLTIRRQSRSRAPGHGPSSRGA